MAVTITSMIINLLTFILAEILRKIFVSLNSQHLRHIQTFLFIELSRPPLILIVLVGLTYFLYKAQGYVATYFQYRAGRLWIISYDS